MEKPTKVEILIGGSIIVALFLAYQNGLFSPSRTRAIDPTTYGNVTIQANALTNKANGIRTLCMSSANWTSSTAYQNMLEELKDMSDANLIALANEYGRINANKDYPTLREMIYSVSMPFNWTAGNLRDEQVNRLSGLGL
jgi:hypothetical protein